MSDPPPPVKGSRLPALGPRGEGWFLLQLLFIALIAVAGVVTGANWSGAPRFAAALAGAVLILGSGALAFLGIRDLGGALSPLPRPMDGAGLVAHGVYRRLRHPIYAGVMLAGLGWSLLTASWVALALSLALAVLLDLKARREEVWLHQHYSDYADYAAHTRRFLPGVY